MAALALYHNATLFDLYFALSIFPVQADDDGSGGGIASWVVSTAALPFPHQFLEAQGH